MAFTVNSRVDAFGAGFAATIASPAQSHTAGRLLVAFVFYNQDGTFPSTISSVTSTAADTWVSAGARIVYLANFFGEMFYVASTNGNAADIVTANFTGAFGSAARSITVYEVSGAKPSSPLGGYSTGTAASVTASTGSITVSTGSEIIIAGFNNNGDSFVNNGTGYTSTVSGSSSFFASEYKTVAASEAATITCANFRWGAVGASFKAATSIKTKKGLQVAGVKTFKGLATASTKTDKGLA